MKDQQRSLSQRLMQEKTMKKKQADKVLLLSPKMGLGNDCPMLNVYDVVVRVRGIGRPNQLIN